MTTSEFRILALDGGGIRGVMTAVLLDELEARLARPLHEVFDLIAGVSTGSILACGLAAGRRAAELRDLYLERGREVFPARPRLLFNRVARVFTPKYRADGLERALQEELGKTTPFGAVRVQTLVIAYNTRDRRPEVLKSWRDDSRHIPMWQVCRASCAAPTYFPGYALAIARNEPPGTPLLDGGLVANNPSACALAEARQLMRERPAPYRIPLDRCLLASFGAGSNAPAYDLAQISRWGIARGARPILNILMDGSVVATDYIVSRMLAPGAHFRFPIPLDEGRVALDDASPANLEALLAIAAEYFNDPQKCRELDRLVERLHS